MESCREPYEGNEPFVFFSYCRRNSDLAYPIIDGLLRAGCRVWYDRGIRAGADWPEYIAKKLEDCAAFAVLLTEESEESTNCKNEFTMASQLQKPMVAMKTESVVLDFGVVLNLGGNEPLIVEKFSDKALVDTLLGRSELKSSMGAASRIEEDIEDDSEEELEVKPEEETKIKQEEKKEEEIEVKPEEIEDKPEEIEVEPEKIEDKPESGSAQPHALKKRLEQSGAKECREIASQAVQQAEALKEERKQKEAELLALQQRIAELQEEERQHRALAAEAEALAKEKEREYPLPLRIIRLSTGESRKETRAALTLGYGEGCTVSFRQSTRREPAPDYGDDPTVSSRQDIQGDLTLGYGDDRTVSVADSGRDKLHLAYADGGYAWEKGKKRQRLENPCVLTLGEEPIYLAWGPETVRIEAEGLRWLYAPGFNEYLLLQPGDTLLGRNGGWNGEALQNGRVSYDHLLLHRVGEGESGSVTVEDHGREGRGSTNGTDVNGKRIRARKAVTLYEGDRITLGTGEVVLEYHCYEGSGGRKR